ncbi:MAG TPA: dienelactone hydrolase family protein [Caulobacteraceae bacterium]|jgi:carboxymethylenebutenolidase|nr:dienelactone hydrolase family protein [Caulobacteraceae bacterium]
MAGEAIMLTGADGFEFGAWRFAPGDARRGGLVLIQEIFGVTDHIRQTAAAYAADGYEVIAPSLYDRRERGFEAGYDAEGVARGRELSEATPWDEVAGDLRACVAALAAPVFAVGYCWGGTAAWLAACRCEGLAAASAYYGRRIPELVEETPLCPIILHFGREDPTIPGEVVEAIGERHPDIPIHLYDAGHGFASDRRTDYREDAARLARLRNLALFSRAGGGRGEA